MAPHRRHEGRSARILRAAVALAVAGMASVSLPPASAATPDEARAARQVAARVEAYFGLLEDPQRLAQVVTVGRRLEKAAGIRSGTVTWRLIDTPQFNALAIPGDRIYVARGLVDGARSEAELAAALAHEMAHVLLGHTRQALEEQAASRRVTLVIENPMPDGTVSRRVVVAEGPKAAPGTRRKELDADREAVHILKRAGYPPDAVLSMLSRLGGSAARPPAGAAMEDQVRGILSSHPSPADRVRHARDYLRAITGGKQTARATNTW